MQRFALVVIFLVAALTPMRANADIFLVRHAEKAQGGDPKDPDLSEAGRARAESLAAILKDAGITAIFVTEFRRTQQTAQPLAQALKLDPIVIPAAETKALLEKLAEIKGHALVVGHSNTLPEIEKGLGVSAPVRVDENEYDNLFLLALSGQPTSLLRLHYH